MLGFKQGSLRQSLIQELLNFINETNNVFCIWIKIFENNFKNKRGEKLFFVFVVVGDNQKWGN